MVATEKVLFPIGGASAAALTNSDLGKAVVIDGSGNVAICSTAGQSAAGILSYVSNGAAGASVSFETKGRVPALLGANVVAGDKLTTNASGALVKASTIAGASADFVAIESGSSGARITVECFCKPGGVKNLRRVTLSFPVVIPTGGSGDLVTSYPIDFTGTIVGFRAVVNVAGTGAGADGTFGLEINGTNVTGAAINATLANTATRGAVLASTAITAANAITAGNTIDVDYTQATAFTGGELTIFVDIDY